MGSLNISGGIVPLNLSVFYTFPFRALEGAIRYFCGDNATLWLQEGEAPGAGLALRDGFVFTGGEDEFERLRVLLTYEHEQYHLRHLTSSPIGFLLYLLGGRQYAYLDRQLNSWGERHAASGDSVRIPVLEQHGDDPEMKQVSQTRLFFGLGQSLFIGDAGALTLGEALTEVVPSLFQEAQRVFSKVLGKRDVYPSLRLMCEPGQSVAINELTGEAVIEGLARMNEMMAIIRLGAPLEVLNRYQISKFHGVYVVATAIVEQFLGLKAPKSWLVAAKFADWALQSPVIPFLLRGRDEVCLEELLPCYRFFMVTSRFGQLRLSPADLQRDERAVAEAVFGNLGWESPYRVAERIRVEPMDPPRSVLTRHYLENLQLGARLREEHPHVLSMPTLGDSGHRLQAIYNVFQDRLVPGTTGKLEASPDTKSLVFALLHDAVVDGILQDRTLWRPFWFARAILKTVEEPQTSAMELVERQLSGVIGQRAATSVLQQAEVLEWMTEQARQLFGEGHRREAATVQEHVFNGRLATLGADDENTLAAKANLGFMLCELGNLARARELQEQVLSTLGRLHDGRGRLVLAARNNLASTLSRQGEFQRALKLHQDNYEAYQGTLGEAHPDTLTSLNNLAMAYYKLARPAEALPLQEKVLALRRDASGEDDPETLNAMNNLAQTLLALDRADQAKDLQERALAARRRVLGDEHPDTLASMQNLANALEALGDTGQAERLLREAIAIQRRRLGRQDPNTLAAISSLALLLIQRRDFEEAARLYQEVYDAEVAMLGREHPDTSVSALSLYTALTQTKQSKAAKKVLQDSLAWLRGRDPSTLNPTQQAVRNVVQNIRE